MTWKEEDGTNPPELKYIGMKLLLFRRPIDTNNDKQVNFLPFYKSNNFIIEGT